jgi:hypothetical protein
MKFSAAVLLSLAAAATPATAFLAAPKAFVRTSSSSRTYSTVASPSATTEMEETEVSAVQEAMQLTERYGPTSPEARVAWDVVSDLEVAWEKEAASKVEQVVPPSSTHADQVQRELYEKLAEMHSVMKEQGPRIQRMEAIMEEIKAIKLPVVGKNTDSASRGAENSKNSEINAALELALQNAKRAEIEYGAESPEAKVAWSEVEEVANAKRRKKENATGHRIFNAEECLLLEDVFSASTCEALAELERFKQEAM